MGGIAAQKTSVAVVIHSGPGQMSGEGLEVSSPVVEPWEADCLLKRSIAGNKDCSGCNCMSCDLRIERAEWFANGFLLRTEDAVGEGFFPSPRKNLQASEERAESVLTPLTTANAG
jgi:hypothetical protein